MRVENWEKDLKKEFSASKNPVQKSKKDSSSAVLLIFLAVLMAAAFLIVGNQKNNGKWAEWAKSQIPFINKKVVTEKVVPPKENNEISEMRSEIMRLRSDLQQIKSEQDESWAKAWNRMNQNHDRIVLLGTLHNENWVIMKNGYNRGHIIFFNQDWTIGKMPQYIRVTPEDREFLEKYLRS